MYNLLTLKCHPKILTRLGVAGPGLFYKQRRKCLKIFNVYTASAETLTDYSSNESILNSLKIPHGLNIYGKEKCRCDL